MSELNHLFKELAKLGICKAGRRLWRMSSKDFDIFTKAWKDWPEYMIEHDYKALALMREFFNEDDFNRLSEKGIFVDSNLKDIELDDGSGNVMINGNSCLEMTVKPWAVVKIYAYHDSKITLHCSERSIVDVELYNNSFLNIVATGSAKAIIYSYDKSTVEREGNVNVIKKEYSRGEVFNGKDYTPQKLVRL